jgi:hypothetical protein
LERTQVTDAGLANLSGLKSLERLYLLGDSHVTDAGLTHLRTLTSLEYLFLHGTQVTDAGIANLKNSLPKLRASK